MICNVVHGPLSARVRLPAHKIPFTAVIMKSIEGYVRTMCPSWPQSVENTKLYIAPKVEKTQKELWRSDDL